MSDVFSSVQGSVLEPYLFTLFISTYHSLLEDTCTVKCADDVALIVPAYKSNINAPCA